MTIGEEQVLELGHRFHCIRPDSLQETEILFSSQHIQDDTEKLQIVARLDDGHHNQARFELVPHPEVAAPIQIEVRGRYTSQSLNPKIWRAIVKSGIVTTTIPAKHDNMILLHLDVFKLLLA